MPPLQQQAAIIGAFHGVLLFGLLISDPRVTGPSRLVGVICLVLALLFCLPLVLTYGLDRPFVFATGWLLYIAASIGGLTYLYCRNTMLGQKLSWRDAIHVTPVLICIILVWDVILWRPEALAAWLNGASANNWRIVVSEYIIFAQALIYLPATIGMILIFRARARAELANFNPAIFNWLLTFTSVIMVFWSLKAVFALTNVPRPDLFSVAADVMIVVSFYVIAIAQWRNPQLFTIDKLGETARSPRITSKSNSLLDASTQTELFKSVTKTVEALNLFQDSELTLSSLAKTTGLSPNHLSEVLNQHAGKNFYEFVNSYRVDFVRRRLEESHELKILDIALEAGFASKSTFNAIFKQYTGQTPTQYKKRFMHKNV